MHLMIRIENRLSRERDAISSSRLSIRSFVNTLNRLRRTLMSSNIETGIDALNLTNRGTVNLAKEIGRFSSYND
jgi:hypothetical protein